MNPPTELEVTVTEAHLNAALAVPWSHKTCLVAQALPFLPEELKYVALNMVVLKGDRRYRYDDQKVTNLMCDFDQMDTMITQGLRGAVAQREKLIREQLPLTFKLTITEL